MAFELKNLDIRKGADTVKDIVKTINEKALETSDELVDTGLETAGKWQKVAAKALKTGTILFGKQQDLFFYTLEGVRKQSMAGVSRVKNLLEIEGDFIPTPTKALLKKEVAEVGKITKKATKKVAKAADSVKTTATKTAVKTASKATKMADARLAKAKPATKKTAKTVKINKSDLKVIDGIGPKMETVLNAAGISTFNQLATADEKAVKAILLEASSRYSMFEPKEWIKEAKKLNK